MYDESKRTGGKFYQKYNKYGKKKEDEAPQEVKPLDKKTTEQMMREIMASKHSEKAIDPWSFFDKKAEVIEDSEQDQKDSHYMANDNGDNSPTQDHRT